MKEQFVTYEIAKAMKELGFNEPCLAWYLPEIAEKGNVCSPILASYSRNWNTTHQDRINCILWQQVIDWFREKYDLHIENGWCISDPFGNAQCGYNISVYNKIKDEFLIRDFDLDFYEARKQSILKAIKVCQKK